MSDTHSAPRVLLTSKQAASDIFGISERSFHSLRSQPWMPKPVVLGPRIVRWVRSELEDAAQRIPRNGAPSEPEALRNYRVGRKDSK